ncbi:phage tail tape measure protein [Oerskovia jenensis]|uniref:TP901 family phage tail tape measure protein n=1 Tax=Oerskovia jenensis TaxID=162169 RepID=A0ABS2LIB3_9CELL|nr:phage tail tape measure protein [Oerskovia jenensis]MBM7480117.1 TP901 family phage tail tape measure protein [Oerskovia jenensis]
MAEATRAVEGVGRGSEDSAARADTALGRMVQSATRNQQAWDRAGTTLTAFGAVTTVALGATVKAAMDWESAWTGVLKTADGSGAQLAALESDLRNLATTLPATHQEIAAVAEAAGQLGVGVDSVASFTKTMVDLGETTNLSADEAATAIAQMANVMDASLLSSKDGVSRFGATLVALGNDGASTEKQILEMAQRISGSGKLVGASEAEVLALSNALASMGITAELGGGVVSRILQDIYSAVKEGGPKLSQFAALAGQSADDFAKAFADDPVRALDAVAQGLNGVDASGGNVVATLKDLGFLSTEEQRVLLQLKGAGDLLTDSLDLANAAWAENSALLDEANKRYDTAEAKVQIARNAINDAAITIGDALLPAVAAGAEAIADLANWFGSLPEPAQQAIGGIGGLVGVTALAAGGFLLLFPRVIETVTAFKTLNATSPGVATGLTRVGKAAGVAVALVGVAAALNEINAASFDAVPSVEQMTRALLKAEGVKGVQESFTGLSETFDDMKGAADRLFTDNINTWADRNIGGLLGLSTATSKAEEAYAQLGSTLAVVYSSNPEEAERRFAAALRETGRTRDELLSIMPAYADAIAETDNTQKLATESATGVSAALDLIAESAPSVTEALAEWMKMVGDADASFSDIAGAYQGVIDKNKEVAQATADATKSSKDSWEDFYDGTSVSMADWIAKLEEQAKAQKNWQDNILAITSEIRTQMPADMAATADAMIDELIALGPEGAAALQTFRDANAEERLRLVEAWAGTGTEISEDFATELDAARTPTLNLDTSPASIEARILAGELHVFGESVSPWEITANSDSAAIEAQILAGELYVFGQSVSPWELRADASKADATAQGTVNAFGQMVPDPFNLSADPFNANQTTSAWLNTPRSTSVSVNADVSPAERAVGRAIAAIKMMTAVIPGIPGGFTGGQVGGIAGFAAGGQVPGTPPSDPTHDNVFAMTERGRPLMVRSKEWIQPQPAVEYYGAGVMRALQYRQIPKSVLAGFAAGGSPSAPQYASATATQAAAPAQTFDLTGLQLVGTLMVNGMEARMEAVAVGVVDARDRSDAGTRQTVGRTR